MQSSSDRDPAYGYTAHLSGVAFEDAKTRTTDALKAQGFGVLTEIDVKTTLKAKIDQDFRQYVILGACHPNLAHQALQAELGIGLLLPCNVCIWEEPGGTAVSFVRPAAMFEVVHRKELQPIADDADQRLRRAFDEITAGAGRQG